MIHGNCNSAGCYAMTDALIEEIYAMARETFVGGHDSFQVHAFPFRMTDENMARHAKTRVAIPSGRTLKEGYDYFEMSRQVPTVAVCNRRYVVNVAMRGGDPTRLDPEGACPAFLKPKPIPSSQDPASRSPSSASSCRDPRCAAWPVSKTVHNVRGSCRPARSARGRRRA